MLREEKKGKNTRVMMLEICDGDLYVLGRDFIIPSFLYSSASAYKKLGRNSQHSLNIISLWIERFKLGFNRTRSPRDLAPFPSSIGFLGASAKTIHLS